MVNKRYYVYTLARPDGRVFYVGKGSGRRTNIHLNEARKMECHCKKCRIIHHIWAAHQEVQINRVFEADNEHDAFDYERALIARLSLTNDLCNKQLRSEESTLRPSRPIALMDAGEYAVHLRKLRLSKSEQEKLVDAWGHEEISGLRGKWMAARARRDFKAMAKIEQEIEEVSIASGRFWQETLF